MTVRSNLTEEQKVEIKEKIGELKKSRHAIILAHNYQREEVQDVADFVGDSLELSRKATQVDADIIVFCGVHFMAESAKILNPSRMVLLPEATAGCPMANMIDTDDLRSWKARYPKAAVVCYVNSSAAVKAESDICCTSANALRIVESLSNDQILFIPDQHLGHYISRKTDKEMILYPGYCITHKRLTSDHILEAKMAHPDALLVVHPECQAEVVEQADAVLSTSQMIRYVKESPARTFLVGTEAGILYRMRQENPEKVFYSASNALLCPNMKKTHIESVLASLEKLQYEILVPEGIRIKAKEALDRMLAI